VRRVAVVGGSCSGKTTVARRLAAILDVPHVELDALHHEAGWQEAPAEVLQERVRDALANASDGWVVDGNYRAKIGTIVLERADTAVFLDPPLPVAFGRAVRRTLVRTITREELWNGNREQPRHLFTRNWIPWWVLRTHRRYRREIPERLAAHELEVVHLRSAAEVERRLQSIQATATTSGSSGSSERQNVPPSVER
jgi:adenylate kinase family enzyme